MYENRVNLSFFFFRCAFWLQLGGWRTKIRPRALRATKREIDRRLLQEGYVNITIMTDLLPLEARLGISRPTPTSSSAGAEPLDSSSLIPTEFGPQTTGTTKSRLKIVSTHKSHESLVRGVKWTWSDQKNKKWRSTEKRLLPLQRWFLYNNFGYFSHWKRGALIDRSMEPHRCWPRPRQRRRRRRSRLDWRGRVWSLRVESYSCAHIQSDRPDSCGTIRGDDRRGRRDRSPDTRRSRP